MQPHQPTLEKLIREVAEARLEEAVLEADGKDLLDRAKEVSQTVQQQVRQAEALV
jgi:hypothetical protein